jgi:CRISPR/Cas system Type II protein with McrA/HNH and RuvC-like nuclease domain
MKEKIIQLHNQGKSYKEIQDILGCSKGTISYHCGDGQKEKSKQRVRSYKKTLNGILKRKKDNFSFANGRRKGPQKRVHLQFSSTDFKEKIINNPKCYLTGRSIDLLQPKTYQCDHIIPVSKGGECSFENLGLVCKDANMAKGDMILSEFLNLCKDVLINHGFKVEKNP